MDVKAQAMVDSELALWKEWAGDSDERKELLPCPLLEPVVLANKRAHRQPQEAPAIKAALDVMQSGWWTQEVANKVGVAEHPFCLNCGPAVLGSAQHRLWPTVKPALTFLRLISIRDRLRLATNSSGREA